MERTFFLFDPHRHWPHDTEDIIYDCQKLLFGDIHPGMGCKHIPPFLILGSSGAGTEKVYRMFFDGH